MGAIDILCATYESTSRTMYGFTYSSNYGEDASFTGKQAIIVKSSTNPADISSINWSVVATIDAKALDDLYPSYTSNSYSCAVDSNGVYSVIAYRVSTTSNSYTSTPGGIRYNPAGTEKTEYSSTGSGSWTKIIIGSGYEWSSPSDYGGQRLLYVNNGGTRSLVHVTSSYSDMNFGTLDESTMILTATSSKTLSTKYLGAKKTFSVGNDKLYVYGADYSFYEPVVGVFSLTNLTAGAKALEPLLLFNATSTLTCEKADTYSGVINNNFYLVCVNPLSGIDPSKLFVIPDLDNNATAIGAGTTLVKDLNSIESFMAFSSDPTPFSLMRKGTEMYSLTLAGSTAGTITGPVNATVSETFGDNPNPKNTSGSDSSSSSSPFPNGLIGGIVAIVIVLGAILSIYIRKMKSRRQLAHLINNSGGGGGNGNVTTTQYAVQSSVYHGPEMNTAPSVTQYQYANSGHQQDYSTPLPLPVPSVAEATPTPSVAFPYHKVPQSPVHPSNPQQEYSDNITTYPANPQLRYSDNSMNYSASGTPASILTPNNGPGTTYRSPQIDMINASNNDTARAPQYHNNDIYRSPQQPYSS
ncbi:hypothetical protein BGZ76_001253 [Entomortierella beljakovae]|nr:hypothetical protein BGZ76_001253 [Entomortierella beljakovae]